MNTVEMVDLDAALPARGLRVIYAENIPSPWSQAALGLFDIKGFDYRLVPYRKFREAIRERTGAQNAPVVLHDDEPPRTGWADILALAQRLGGRVSLVPDEQEQEVRMFGLCHALMSEGGLGWSVRLLLTHASLTTDGREGWPLQVATYLAPKYGYAPERAEAARARAVAVLDLLTRTLDGHGGTYMLGHALTALDVYAAVTLGVMVPLPQEVCPMPAVLRHAVGTLDPQVRAAVSPSLLRHREMMYARHLRTPVQL
jgi:glutathione S-transferase